MASNIGRVMTEVTSARCFSRCFSPSFSAVSGTLAPVSRSLAITPHLQNGECVMASMNKFPPDVPKDWDETRDDVEAVTNGLRSKAADMAGRASETVKESYSRAKDALTETGPVELAREGGEMVVRTVERHPLAAFSLGALSVGLIAWASLRPSPPQSRWERYQPDYGRWRSMFQDYRNDTAHAGDSVLKAGGKWLRGEDASDYAERAREYADYGGRMLARRAEREPIAALLGIGIAIYFLGSLLTSSSEQAPAQARRRTAKR
jgi:hypothetical protein